MRYAALSIAVMTAQPVAAQQFLVVPSSAAVQDAGSATQVPGFDQDGRMQILVGAAHLAPMAGRDLTALSFRREVGRSGAFDGGTAAVSIELSPAARAPVAASPSFADNRDPNPGRRIIVFSGQVAIPASADPNARTVDWASGQDAVRIAFQVPYPYAGGDLCVDLSGDQVVGNETRFWSVDGVLDPAIGTVTEVGATCGGYGGFTYPPASTVEHALVAGSTASFSAYGPPGASGALLIGTPLPAFDLSLLGLGGPGCELHVDPIATLGAVYVPLDPNPAVGHAARLLHVPADPTSLAFPFRAQFVALSLPVETSNALDCRIGAIAPSLDMATVFANRVGGGAPPSGRVRSGRAPVLRFEFE